jgi:hypothetical protein
MGCWSLSIRLFLTQGVQTKPRVSCNHEIELEAHAEVPVDFDKNIIRIACPVYRFSLKNYAPVSDP